MQEKQSTKSTKVEQSILVKTIGNRLREARELCNLSQITAAKRFGYSNSSKLSKIEGATDTNSVPLWFIFRAAKVYEVSLDFLFGITDDWETGIRMTQEREVSGWVMDAFEKARYRDLDTLKKLNDKIEAITGAIFAQGIAADEANAALLRFIELNPDFEDMKAGSTLVAKVGRVSDAAKNAKAKITKFKLECTIAAKDSNQLSLALL